MKFTIPDTDTKIWSTSPSHPGETLAALMEKRGMSANDVAEASGSSVESINQISNGKLAISPELCEAFGAVFVGIPPQFWFNRQYLYDAAIEHNRENDRIYKPQLRAFRRHFPTAVYNDLVDQGYVRWEAPPAERVRSLCEMFGNESLEAVCESEPRKRFRDAPNRGTSRGALAAWLWKGEGVANDRVKSTPLVFDRGRLLDAATKLRAMTTSDLAQSLAAIRAVLSDAGIVFVALPHLTKCGVRGAAWRLDSGHPAVQVNDHGKTADRFWFTLFHELGHVYHGHENSLDFDNDDPARSSDRQEAEADRFAQDVLVPAEEWRSFEFAFPYTEAKIIDFADGLGIDPGIVAGRLAKQHYIGWGFARQFSTPFDLTCVRGAKG